MDYNIAQKKVKDLKSFYKNCMWFAIVASIILIRNFVKYAETDHSFRGSIVLAVWGIILTIKAIKLFFLNADWENKILQEELNKEKRPINF
ncbi:2TM domain-containing protein [Chryseobacterium chendengshani]|uniref:2TM domain-containing protein n=1 Tax=Chryseobacterium sp. LJ756 TaxID=2864113 RepID=UPI001C63FCDF|nr:2TM domain-containing protein [Chryseobacterium sp. LJ756]MBW7675349.1 2TM domain-containing protein [Chryseobacterium sp. LJ756]